MNSPRLKRLVSIVRWPLGVAVIIFLTLAVVIPLAYHSRVYPGVVVNGVNIGGKSEAEALRLVKASDAKYANEPIVLRAGRSVVRVKPVDMGLVAKSEAAVDQALDYGRNGGGLQRWRSEIRALMGRQTVIGLLDVNAGKLAAYTVDLADDVATPVQNAVFSVEGNTVAVQPDQKGARLDMFAWVNELRWHVATGSSSEITLPTTTQQPVITTKELDLLKDKVAGYVSAPIALSSPDKSKTVTLSQTDIASWLGASRSGITDIAKAPSLETILHTSTIPIQIGLSSSKVDEYVASLAGTVDQDSVNAVLTSVNGKVAIAKAAQSGLKLDVAKTSAAIKDVLDKPASERNVTMVAATTQAEIREDNLDALGIKEKISTGTTYFPGSPYTRLINVRAGAAKFNGVLLKPGEVFSFGKLLGDVNASTGYVPELVILNNHEEKQYGGGLCQVSSTAYRAALLAGLPILQRQNHSFAISYYTAPYGVPGVDATIYYPAVDMKFRNDTPGHIYMQTSMVGTTLTFDYYGTKTKYGEIRGPQFVSGDGDATKPSHTVFYRDVKDLSGNVIKTDEVNTFYQSSLNFPITKQFN